MTVKPSYREFLEAKTAVAQSCGFEVDDGSLNAWLKPHARAAVKWALAGGCRAIFASFGLAKTSMQLELMRQHSVRFGVHTLIVIPLGVRQEFRRDAEEMGILVKFIRRAEEIDSDIDVHLTNYETVRDGKLDPSLFGAASLDEASVLRGFGGTKTFREFMRRFEHVRYRYVATATPSPNDYIELLAYAAFLGIMDVGQTKTRFFKRDSENADELTIHPHKEEEFWLWVASWALFIQRPSDLGFSDEGYDLPPLDVRWHEVPSDHKAAGEERDGQGRMFRNAAIGVVDAAREKRDSLPARMAKLMELRAEDISAHRLLWHDLEAERAALERAIPSAVSVYGSQDLDEREQAIIDFSEGRIQELAAKPVIAGSGCNFQRHCAWAIFLGIGFKFNDFIQAIHRIRRFLQTKPCRIDLIYSEAEREVRATLEEKWRKHDAMMERMSTIIRQYGLTQLAMGMQRSLGVERQEIAGRDWRFIHNDCVDECARIESDSVHLIVTSIPFSTQYEYTPSYNDFGHTDDDAHFWAQMDYLIPELLRVLKPGRVACVHVKDRIVPGGLSGFGFPSVSPFSDDCIAAFRRHGFALLSRVTITTDVVRENNQTYRLGWSEECKDGTVHGNGMPEYLLTFRKPPTDRSNGYADERVAKPKPLCADHGEAAPFDKKTNWRRPVPATGYTRARWQFDAHGYWRSSGDRLLTSEELVKLPHEQLFKLWRSRSAEQIYDFPGHVAVAEDMDRLERLPATFMVFPPHSNHPQVWSDIARMRTLNGQQQHKGREIHLCPLQFDTVDRCILQRSMEGEIVLDPFAGIGTVPYCALKLGRKAIGVELSPRYFPDAVYYCRQAESEAVMPTLFDLLDVQPVPVPAETAAAGSVPEPEREADSEKALSGDDGRIAVEVGLSAPEECAHAGAEAKAATSCTAQSNFDLARDIPSFLRRSPPQDAAQSEAA